MNCNIPFLYVVSTQLGYGSAAVEFLTRLVSPYFDIIIQVDIALILLTVGKIIKNKSNCN
jgi:hypothetical protein